MHTHTSVIFSMADNRSFQLASVSPLSTVHGSNAVTFSSTASSCSFITQLHATLHYIMRKCKFTIYAHTNYFTVVFKIYVKILCNSSEGMYNNKWSYTHLKQQTRVRDFVMLQILFHQCIISIIILTMYS